VYSYDTIEETIGKQGLNEALRFFCLSFKKCESNPVGSLILDHIRNHADWLNRYLMKDKLSHDQFANKITNDMNLSVALMSCGMIALITGWWITT
jgi:hypothetical protein